ncbi:mitochondrial coenzyme A transporter SLC25A42 isoform X2 [Vanessa atalanta]|uniref:mitochondrial coenzyme A transporter SLC25A42 isoform X2 n=1 Tax=Vanessa atalanta TaxID=42275 RepID=UPI001FCD48ED|nr:mitochondrial coenzyme A transporter SLC25A42 isoform X2 [Vanessa atalanta]
MAVGEARVPLLHDDRHAHHAKGDPPRSRQLSGSALVITSLVAGASAGAIAKTVIAPLDRAKINFQTSDIPYSWRAAVRFLTHSAQTEGWTALWRGNSATMARIVPYAAIQFTAHEQWKKLLGVDTPQTAQEAPLRLLVAGSLAGVTSQSATYPLDLARARMAVADYRSLRAMFKRVIKDEGFITLYRGYPATVMGVIPYAGVSFFTYDSLRHWYIDYTGADRSYPCPTVPATLAAVYRAEGWRGFFKGLSMNWIKGPIAVGISFASYDTIKSTLRDIALSLN